MKPTDVALNHTLGFVVESLPPSTRRLLEIGCGVGELAAALKSRGLVVRGIDRDPVSVAAASARGVDAHTVDWPNSPREGGFFDAVLFSRSAHHLNDLSGAMRGAAHSLAPGGTLLIEDFDCPAAVPLGVSWLHRQLASLDAAGAFVESESAFLTKISDGLSPTAAWLADHDHGVHPWHAIEEAAREEFRSIRVTPCAYLYRYAVEGLGPTAHGAELAASLLELEEQASREVCPLIGRRLIAVRNGPTGDPHGGV